MKGDLNLSISFNSLNFPTIKTTKRNFLNVFSAKNINLRVCVVVVYLQYTHYFQLYLFHLRLIPQFILNNYGYEK